MPANKVLIAARRTGTTVMSEAIELREQVANRIGSRILRLEEALNYLMSTKLFGINVTLSSLHVPVSIFRHFYKY